MYYFVFLFGAVLSLCSLARNSKKIPFIAFTILIALMAFLRYGVGADYFAYRYLYSRLSYSFVTEFKQGLDSQEIGFRLLGTFLKKCGLSYQQYLIVIATLNLIYVGKLSKRFSENPMLSMLIYYCFYYFVWTFSGLRQGLVISIGLYYLLDSIENQRVLRFLVIVSVLASIHSSALVLFALYFASRLEFLDRNKLMGAGVCAILVSTLPIGLFVQRLQAFAPILDRIVPYIEDQPSLVRVLDLQTLGRLPFVVLILIHYDALLKKGKLSKQMVHMYMVSMFMYFIFKFSEITAARLAIYGKMLEIIILPSICYTYRKRTDRCLVVYGLCLLCLLYLGKELLAMEAQTGLQRALRAPFVPYTHVFDKGKVPFDSRYAIFEK